jgi:hypothetical protein
MDEIYERGQVIIIQKVSETSADGWMNLLEGSNTL